MNIFYSYSDYSKDVEKISEYCFEHRVTDIISIYRGSLIPGTHLAHKTKLPLSILKFQTYNGSDKEPIFLHNALHETSRILVLDEISDSGNTFKIVDKFLLNLGYSDKRFISLHSKNDLYPSLHKTNKWVQYWWEL
jgi:hypoxanthine phosphoribosyltransferase